MGAVTNKRDNAEFIERRSASRKRPGIEVPKGLLARILKAGAARGRAANAVISEILDRSFPA